MDLREIQAKNILSKCGIPGIDYVINPYTGCKFGCVYCYASFMGRFIQDKSVQDWGNYVFVKINAPELLKKEIAKLKDRGKGLEIFLSSVTDPYQGVEVKYKITRQCLQIISDYGFIGGLSILTKSDLVLRDIDILKTIKHVSVGLTITSVDDNISKYFEKNAPPVSQRFFALKELNSANVNTYAFVGPLLPHFVANEAGLDKLFKQIAETGTKDIFVEHINLSKYIKSRLMVELKDLEPELLNKFYFSQSTEYREQLNFLIEDLIKKYKLNLLTGNIIFHEEYQKTESKNDKPWKHIED